MGSVRRKSIVTCLVWAAALTAAPALAEPWTGTSGVGVEVEDRQGRALAGAEVRLRWAEGEAESVPATVATGADGRAAIRGLAPGRWELTVRHPETMAYVATVRIRERRRPKELNATQVKVGESLRSLRVRYFAVSGPAEHPAEPVRPPEPAPAPEPAPVEPEALAPEPEPGPAPEPVAEPDVSAPEALPRRGVLRAYEQGTCVECRAGEWAVSSRGVAAAGGGVCPPDLEGRMTRAAALLGSSRALGPWTGPIELAGGASSVLGEGAHRELTGALRPVLADDASCRVLAVLLPAGATFVGFQYEAASGDRWARCPPGEECGGEGNRWSGEPQRTRTPAGTVVSGAFTNRGSEPVPVRLTVYFTAPEGWKPP